MSTNYAKQLPYDKYGSPMQEFPAPFRANARYGKENAQVSSVITLNDNTSVVEIAATGGAVAMRWVATSDTQASVVSIGAGANFDHIIPADEYRRFVVPIESQGVPSIVGINKQAGLYNRFAVMAAGSGGNASVYAAEF